MQKYEYQCSKGHWQESPRETTKCMAYIKGSPCPGTLKRVGVGSRSTTQETTDDDV